MNRRHVQHFLSDYIDGSLSAAATRSVAAHLASCPECARELEQWRAVLRMVAFHAPMACPIDCAEAVLSKIAAQRMARLVDGRTGSRHEDRQALRSSLLGSLTRLPSPAASALVLAVMLLGGAA